MPDLNKKTEPIVDLGTYEHDGPIIEASDPVRFQILDYTIYIWYSAAKTGRRRMTARAVQRLLGNEGWEMIRQRGSHQIWRKGRFTTIVPVHGSRDIPAGTLRSIMRQIEEAREDETSG